MDSKSRATVAECAKLALGLFQQCLHLAASLTPREFALVEDQVARLSIWTSSIGVFAAGKASMDHRLREAPDVHEVVTSLFETLSDSIQGCISALEATVNARETASNGTSSPSLDLESSIRAVANDITLLYRLSNTIRRASRESQNLKGAKLFHIRDDEGNDVEPLLRELYANYLLGRFPNITDILRHRLASSMVLRRKRILYRRSRYGHEPIRIKKAIAQPKLEHPVPQHQEVDTSAAPDGSEPPTDNLAPPQSVVRSAAPSATTLVMDEFKKASTPSVISATKTASLSNHENLVFPPAPIGHLKKKYNAMKREREDAHTSYLQSLPGYHLYQEYLRLASSLADIYSDGGNREADGSFRELREKVSTAEIQLKTSLELDWNACLKSTPEVICPFCLYALPTSSISDEQKWRTHVTSDLDAYVCLFDDCNQANELFSHGRDWLQHMREHSLRWRCNSKSHGTLVFLTEAEYLSHIREVHGGSFTEPQLRVLAEKNGRPIGPMFESCAICGTVDTPGSLEDHIVGHLRSLALMSLPAYEDEASEASDSEKGSSASSKPVSRPTVQDDHDKHITPVFEDTEEDSTWGTFPPPASPEPKRASKREALISAYRKISRSKEKDQNISKHKETDQEMDLSQATLPLSWDPVNVPWHADPSRDFVNLDVFKGISKGARRKFEWGFLTETTDQKQGTMVHDPVMQMWAMRKNAPESQHPGQYDREIRFMPWTDPRATRPSLTFTAMTRTVTADWEAIRVGRWSDRESSLLDSPSGAGPVGFKSKVVSRQHCEFWQEDGKWYIRDVKSSSGTFLNYIRLSSPNTESKPFLVNDGDIVQLGIDFKGGEETIFRCVKIKLGMNQRGTKGEETTR